MAYTVLFLAVSSILIATSSAYRILMCPCFHRGHVNMFAVTGKALQEAGHQVDVLVMESRRFLVDDKGVGAVTYATVPEASDLETDAFLDKVVMVKGHQMFDVFNEVTRLSTVLLEGIVGDADLMNKLESSHYDLAIVDGVDCSRSLYLIPYILNLRYITLSARHDPWNAGIPVLPSVEHLIGITDPVTENSTIFQRIKSLVNSVMIYRLMPFAVLKDSLIARLAPTRPKVTFVDLYRASEMWITNLDSVCLDFPLMHSNHLVYVAPLSLQPVKPLPQELETFVQGSKVGVIILTFGSALKTIPAGMVEKMLEAFSQTEHRVIMRHNGEITDKFPANVKVLPWLPQGDLLGHPKTRIFITHGGRYGQMEALYHGVPMITIPMFGDGFYNAKRVEEKGFGITLDKYSFTSDELLRAIQMFSKDREVRRRIQSCSERLQRMPNAHDTVVFWVEYIIRFGGDHLKPVALHMPMWKTFMLDILALFIILILILYTLMLLVCCKLYQRLFRSRTELSSKKSL